MNQGIEYDFFKKVGNTVNLENNQIGKYVEKFDFI